MSTRSILRKSHSAALAEGAGAFHALAVGACIALIRQGLSTFGELYRVHADLDAPRVTYVVYLLRSSAVAIIYVAGITAWAGDLVVENRSMLWFWPLIALVLPFYAQLIKRTASPVAPGGCRWRLPCRCPSARAFNVIAPFSSVAACFQRHFYFALSGGLRLVSQTASAADRHPFIFVGQLGIVVLTIWLSYRFAWQSFPSSPEVSSQTWIIADSIAYGFCALALILFALCWMRKMEINPVAGLLPAVILSATFLLRAGLGMDALLVEIFTRSRWSR